MIHDYIPWCSCCGECCSGEHQWGVILLPGDYERWCEEGRDDILKYIETSARGFRRAIIWKNPDTDEYFDRCPFLSTDDDGKRVCRIQDTKPAICGMFWCAQAYGAGDRGVPFKTVNGWSQAARESGYMG